MILLTVFGSRVPRTCAFLTGMLVAALVAGQSPAQDQSGSERINLATAFVVDPSWPQPGHPPWADVPGIAVDAHDQVYVFTRNSGAPVQVYDAHGKFLRTWGEGIIKNAHHIKIDQKGHVWVADVSNHVIQKYTPEGKLLLTLGTRGVSGTDHSHFNAPTDMAITPAGDIFVSDGYGNSRVVHFKGDGTYVKEWGKRGTKPGEFHTVHAIALDSKGRLYVADRTNVRVQVFDQNGRFLDAWNNLLVPWGFCVTKNDEIWVCGSSPMQWREKDTSLGCPPKDQVFMKFSPQGKMLQLWTVPKGIDGLEKPGECNWVHAIAVDSHGDLYVGDIKGRRAQKFVRKDH